MAKDAVATMGAVLPAGVGGRDAVHVAVISVQAAQGLWPGCDVGVVETEAGYIASRNATPHIGIVDPFIKETVQEDQRFWLFLYPRTITSLSHAWSHPAFPDKPVTALDVKKQESERWLREFVARADCPNYTAMLSILNRIADGATHGQIGEDDDTYFRLEDDYLHFSGTDAHGEIPPEFWDHASIVVGTNIKGARPLYFSCSC